VRKALQGEALKNGFSTCREKLLPVWKLLRKES
jgi:hypothetical protein